MTAAILERWRRVNGACGMQRPWWLVLVLGGLIAVVSIGVVTGVGATISTMFATINSDRASGVNQ